MVLCCLLCSNPFAQNTKKSKQTKTKTESKNTKKTLDSAINTTEYAVTKALQTKQTLNTEQTNTNRNLYEKRFWS